jgi:hypothetical protein
METFGSGMGGVTACEGIGLQIADCEFIGSYAPGFKFIRNTQSVIWN